MSIRTRDANPQALLFRGPQEDTWPPFFLREPVWSFRSPLVLKVKLSNLIERLRGPLPFTSPTHPLVAQSTMVHS